MTTDHQLKHSAYDFALQVAKLKSGFAPIPDALEVMENAKAIYDWFSANDPVNTAA